MSAHDHDHNPIAHVASKKVLLATITTLLALTIITVMATWIDVGKAGNLTIAMVIATIKATLVCMYFMHLRYDKKFHTVAIATALLFAILFVGFALMDRGAYLPDVIWDAENPPTNP
ncbi:MAG: cytochrome C oxidase subunit IV family protein [Deltaproteobacteria bacterium]|nr:cytochrome C oxidase subunit IV family protein [Deltaproteobacteria bacterium]